MPSVVVGKKIPAFTIATTSGEISAKSLLGQPYVLYFYPKDDTPGCTLEGQDFAAQHAKFKRRGVAVVGISRDSLLSHEKFKAKYGLPFALAADPDEQLCRLFDVIKEKNMYGKKVFGIERSTFLVDGQGVLRREWRKVKVDGHVTEVLEATKDLEER